MSLPWYWYPGRRFSIASHRYRVSATARTNGLHTVLRRDGELVDADRTPLFGEEALRNHRLGDTLLDGRRLEVEAGYIGPWAIGIVARVDGQVVHESHPGQQPRFPEKYRQQTIDPKVGAFDPKNRLPLAVDIATGLLFFAIAKLTDLRTAALVGAAVGLGLLVFQRVTRIDVTGGLALFGIAMLLISAGLSIVFDSDEAIKQRGTITGLIAATLFLFDGLLGGKRLAKALARYMPYPDLDLRRLGLGIGAVGLVMAALNFLVARFASTDLWLFYSTFADFVVTLLLFMAVLCWARPAPTTLA